MHTALQNPFQFAEVTPSSANSAGASSPQVLPCDAPASNFASPMTMEVIEEAPAVQPNPIAGATDFPRGFDPEKFFETIEPLPIFLEAPTEALKILARWA